jgi:protein-L-isoaspartate(D-aspartate) O-methyltransferase
MTHAMNFEVARHHMIEQQLRPWDVLDPAVVDVLYADHREDFVPAPYRALAFADTDIPLGSGASMLPPKLEAHALQALAVKPHERVLEVGTGSGHMAALLAACAKEVWSVEIDPALAEQARANLSRRGVANVHVEVGDGLIGLAARAPFDVIMVSGAVREIPVALIEQLANGGRLLAFVGEAPVIAMRRLTRNGPEALLVEDIMETEVPALQQASAIQFSF